MQDAGGSVILSDTQPGTFSAQLAPFLAEAADQLQSATDGLPPDEAIEHLETALAATRAEASRMGLVLATPPIGAETQVAGEGDNQVVVIRQMVDPGDA